MMETINIATDYSRFPGGRYPEDGPGNGTTFRKKFLVPAMSAPGKVKILLDGAAGYPSSFLEEAFGGLVRREGYTKESVLEKFNIVAKAPSMKRHILRIEDFIKLARPEEKAES